MTCIALYDLRLVLMCIFLCSWNSLLLKAQCPDSDLILTSNEEILAFAKKYPKCKHLKSSLKIGPSEKMSNTRITNISGIQNLERIDGDLSIVNNPWLEDLSPIENIQSIGGKFLLQVHEKSVVAPRLRECSGLVLANVNPSAVSVSISFPNLIKINGDLNIGVWNKERYVFPKLWKVSGNVTLSGNSNVVIENEFPELNQIGGELRPYAKGYGVIISIMPSLKKIKSFEGLYIGTDLICGCEIEYCEEMRYANNKFFKHSLRKLQSLKKLHIDLSDANMTQQFQGLKYVDKLSFSGGSVHLKEKAVRFEKLEKVNEFTMSTMKLENIVQNIDTIQDLIVNIINDSILILSDLKFIQSLVIQGVNASYCTLTTNHPLKSLRISENKKLVGLQLNLPKGIEQTLRIQENYLMSDLKFSNIGQLERCSVYILWNKNFDICQSDICSIIKASPTISLEISNNKTDCPKTYFTNHCK